jgi:thiamine biosynthesis lipoprotein
MNPSPNARVPTAGWAVAALLLTACQPVETYRRPIPMFGTMAEVQILGRDAAQAAAALDDIEALYARLDRDWRMFGDGELGRANQALGEGRSATLSPDLAHLVRRGLEMQALSGGLFEPRIGSLVGLWGFEDLARRTPQQSPDPGAIETLRARSIVDATVHLEDNRLWSDAPVALDLNGIAEGAALRAGAAVLGAHGVTSALIDTGGDLLALGRHGNRPWRIGVRSPHPPGIVGTVDLESGEAVASSGNYERRFGPADEDHHILDPGTGRPARGGSGTTVIARDAELADAAATTLMVAGPERFAEVVARMGLEFALLIAEDGRVEMTAGMRLRLRPVTAPAAAGTTP